MKRLIDPALLLAALAWLAVLIVTPDTFAGIQAPHAGQTATGIVPQAAGPCHVPGPTTTMDKDACAWSTHAGSGVHACCTAAVAYTDPGDTLLPFSPLRHAVPIRALQSRTLPPPEEPPRA